MEKKMENEMGRKEHGDYYNGLCWDDDTIWIHSFIPSSAEARLLLRVLVILVLLGSVLLSLQLLLSYFYQCFLRITSLLTLVAGAPCLYC